MHLKPFRCSFITFSSLFVLENMQKEKENVSLNTTSEFQKRISAKNKNVFYVFHVQNRSANKLCASIKNTAVSIKN